MVRKRFQNPHFNNSLKNFIYSFSVLLFLLTLLMCDKKNDDISLPPVAVALISTSEGLTTSIYKFDASSTESGTKGDELYYRWDWEGDGIWDEEFSSNPVFYHRYYSPAIYKPILQALNSSGLSDSCILNVDVKQGFSAPRALFSITPDSGNFLTEFTFDASLSEDDEDSLDQLLFRWDWEGDHHWDTEFLAAHTVMHSFTEIGNYTPILEVIDPKGYKSDYKKTLQIDQRNPRLLLSFEWDPIHPLEKDTIHFDASASKNLDHLEENLIYFWKIIKGLPGDSFEDETSEEWAGPFQEPFYNFVINQEGNYYIGLRIVDNQKLQNQSVKALQVFHKNRPPIPVITTSTTFGNLTTQFLFNGWETKDVEDLISTIQVRWDFDGDNRWDTEFTKEKIVYHQYPNPGTYKAILEALDPHGLSDTTSVLVTVSPGTNETGIVLDKRWGANEYYSTVKIGDQWWMAENMNYAPFRYTDKVDTLASTCYNDESYNCEIHGGLYTAYSATQLNNAEKAQGICPDDWHIPSKGEWETLINTIGGTAYVEDLLVGGSTDFNATYAGYSYKRYVGLDEKNRPIYKWTFTGKGGIGYYWTSTTPRGDAKNWNHWTVTFSRNSPYYSGGYSGNSTFYSVRCIKN